ncbi:MAG: ACP phosphodiesterase [Siphonobacter sp.]
MNFLAHLVLSGENQEIQVGNLLGEFVKGRLEKYHPAGISDTILVGVKLHRSIDNFTDHHPVTRRSKQRLVEEYGLLSGILIDMFYDYVLAHDWPRYQTSSLSNTAQNFYEVLKNYAPVLPEVVQPVIHSMVSRDWLTNYATLDGIEWSLRGIGKRFSPAAGIERSIRQLQDEYELFRSDFDDFWPEISHHCSQFLKDEHV